MHCTECGEELDDDAAFCPNCGTAVEATTAEKSSSANTTESGTQGGGTAHAGGRAEPVRESSSSGISDWSTTRLATLGGGLLAGASLFMPWVAAIRDGFSANGMATEFAPIVMAGVAVTLVGAFVSWGRGWGRLSMVFTGLGGLGIAGIAVFFQSYVSETLTYGVVRVDGQRLPVAALEPATGVQLAILAGAVIAVASLAGLLGSFTSS